jgi:hypothetical protein
VDLDDVDLVVAVGGDDTARSQILVEEVVRHDERPFVPRRSMSPEA